MWISTHTHSSKLVKNGLSLSLVVYFRCQTRKRLSRLFKNCRTNNVQSANLLSAVVLTTSYFFVFNTWEWDNMRRDGMDSRGVFISVFPPLNRSGEVLLHHPAGYKDIRISKTLPVFDLKVWARCVFHFMKLFFIINFFLFNH